MSVEESWAALVEGLRLAGERLGAQTVDLDPRERADSYRALVRALNNSLGRFEVDRERPELVAFNGWREKLLMDNPDFRYWVADAERIIPPRTPGTRQRAADGTDRDRRRMAHGDDFPVSLARH